MRPLVDCGMIDHIRTWLEERGLGSHAAALVGNEDDAEVLLDLRGADLGSKIE
jgi:hypothetical protein